MPISKGFFTFFDPHPYIAAGAPYAGTSPWMLRKGALERLERAQTRLQKSNPGWKIMIFDAYRPRAVQAFMVERERVLQARAAGLDLAKLTPAERESLDNKVYRVWGIPSDDPATPPLHSTGGATDVTLVDESGRPVDMGGEIDENSDRSNPDYYDQTSDEAGRRYHANRELLHQIMTAEGFCRLHSEWWHFSFQDQYWAWQQRESGQNPASVAAYGRADLL